MTFLLREMSRIHNFTIKSHSNYNPSRATMEHQLGQMREKEVYVNHARFINMNNDTYAWINVIRNPVDRWNSLHYYNVDASLRGGLAKLELGRRKQDTLRVREYGILRVYTIPVHKRLRTDHSVADGFLLHSRPAMHSGSGNPQRAHVRGNWADGGN